MLCNSAIAPTTSTSTTTTTTTTPPWLRRLHASKGLSFPPHLPLDLFLHAPHNPPNPPKPHHPPRPKPNPSPNPSAISSIVSELFVMPCPPAPAPPQPPPKSLRKQPRPRAARSPPPRPAAAAAGKGKARGRKRRRSAAAVAGEGEERRTRTEVTVIDTSTEGWKAAKLLLRKGSAWKVKDKKALWGGVGEWKRRRKVDSAGRVAASEKEVDKAAAPEKAAVAAAAAAEKDGRVGDSDDVNINAINEDAAEDLDDQIEPPVRRPRFSGPVPEGKTTSILRLQITNKAKKHGVAGLKGTPKVK